MDNQFLRQQMAYLEFVNDQLVSELAYIDQLLKIAGFANGIQTLKQSAQEVLEEQSDDTAA
jgi:hypothetical protein